MEMSKISTRKIYEEIADRIKAQIEGGALRPGHKLPSTRELSENFQVGRSTVREALSALKAMGYLEIRQGEGSFVREPEASAGSGVGGLVGLQMDRQTVLELLEARKALELANAAIAAEKRTDEDLAAFASLLQEMDRNLGSEAEGERLDIQFHVTLARATHNSIMGKLLSAISTQMETAIRETRRLQLYANRSVSARLLEEHRSIFEAVRDKDPDRARESMKRHLFHVEQVLMKYI